MECTGSNQCAESDNYIHLRYKRNKLTETNALGTTAYTYNSLGQVLTMTDVMNGVWTNTYNRLKQATKSGGVTKPNQTENGFISNEELVETVVRIRKVDGNLNQRFSDLLGVRASIIMAGSSREH